MATHDCLPFAVSSIANRRCVVYGPRPLAFQREARGPLCVRPSQRVPGGQSELWPIKATRRFITHAARVDPLAASRLQGTQSVGVLLNGYCRTWSSHPREVVAIRGVAYLGLKTLGLIAKN